MQTPNRALPVWGLDTEADVLVLQKITGPVLLAYSCHD
jgi:hypothetical protein